MRLKITFTDKRELEVDILPGDIVKFERQYGISSAAADKDPRVEHALFLAHRASTRLKLTDSKFDDWLDTVEDIDPVKPETVDGEEADPLEPPAA